MLADTKPRVDAIPTDRNVREIIAVCAKHGLSYGHVGDFALFMQTLALDKHFAMNFWAAVARIERNSGVLPPGALLEAIVSAVTGANIEQIKASGPSEAGLVTKLASMLAGEDLQPPEIVAPLEPEPEETRQFEMTARRLEKARQRFLAETQTNGARTKPLSEPVPLPDEILIPIDRPRLILEPEQYAATKKPVPALTLGSEEEQPVSIPLASYAESTRRTPFPLKTVVLLLILVFLGFGLFIAFRSRNLPVWTRLDASVHAGYSAAITAWKAPDAHSTTPLETSTIAPQSPEPTTPQTATPPPQPVSGTTPAPGSSVLANRIASSPTPAHSTHPQSDPIFDDSHMGTADGSPNVVVHAAEMKQYLISSRVPLYPDDARNQGISGNVVMEAVVSPSGTVQHIHVLDGDPALRHAAVDAVSAWRYRPYLVNGQPTAVATTISVYVGPEH